MFFRIAFSLLLFPTFLFSQNSDESILLDVYNIQQPTFETTMRLADASSMPVFLLTPVSAVIASQLSDSYSFEDAYLLGASEVATAGLVLGLKVLIGRNRPYKSIGGIEYRRGENISTESGNDSFPSGHSALAFSIATSLSLKYTKWYVIVPAYLWATGVATSRMWFGVHYPSDVFSGALLGTGITVLFHKLGNRMIPSFLQQQSLSFEVQPLQVTLRKRF